MRLLVEGGAPLGNADDEGLTPLHLAAYSGKLEERLYTPSYICIKGRIYPSTEAQCATRITPSCACSERLAHCVCGFRDAQAFRALLEGGAPYVRSRVRNLSPLDCIMMGAPLDSIIRG